MAEVYSEDLECYKDIKEAAIEGRKKHALRFWHSLDSDGQNLFHDCAIVCGYPKAHQYFLEKQEQPAHEEEESDRHGNDKMYDKCWDGYEKVPGKKRGEEGSCVKAEEEEEFPKTAVNQCLMLLQSDAYKADPELAYDMFGDSLVNHCKSLLADDTKNKSPVKEEVEENTDLFKDLPPVEAEYEFLNSNKWALVSKEKDNVPTGEVDIPEDVFKDLTSNIKDIEMRLEIFKDPGYRLEKQDAGMYVSQLESLHQLKELLEDKTVVNVQKAMIYLTSLQSPIFHAMPRSVRQYLMKGYNNKSLLDYFRERK